MLHYSVVNTFLATYFYSKCDPVTDCYSLFLNTTFCGNIQLHMLCRLVSLHDSLDTRHQTLDPTHQTLDTRPQTLDTRHQTRRQLHYTCERCKEGNSGGDGWCNRLSFQSPAVSGLWRRESTINAQLWPLIFIERLFPITYSIQIRRYNPIVSYQAMVIAEQLDVFGLIDTNNIPQK